jgi:hypothetical protein
MAYEYSVKDELWFGLSTEEKPVNSDKFEKCMELDTGNLFIFKDGIWYPL